MAASTWKGATGCPDTILHQGPSLEVFSLLFEFGLAQEIIAVAKTNEYNHTEAAISFSHTQTSLVWHLLSFCELPPLFARKFVYQFWIPAASFCNNCPAVFRHINTWASLWNRKRAER
jgi:thiol-disulfide isomerase/thioredoxin